MKLCRHAMAVMALGSVLSGVPVQAGTVTIGDPAPAFDSGTWLKGGPIRTFAKGHIYVVEFWATWCGGCVANIPKLNELAQKYRGQATFIGVDIRENQEGKPDARLLKRIRRAADRMDYWVVMDDWSTNAVEHAWRLAVPDRQPIPTAFIVDGEGRIAFKHMGEAAGLDLPLSQLIAGTLDREKVRQELANEEGTRQKESDVMKNIDLLLRAADYAGALKATDMALPANPQLKSHLPFSKLTALMHINDAQAVYFALRNERDLVGDSGWPIAEFLTTCIAQEAGLSQYAYAFAIDWLENARPELPKNWQLIASAYRHAGNLTKAIEAQKILICEYEKEANDPFFSLKSLNYMKRTLAQMQAEQR